MPHLLRLIGAFVLITGCAPVALAQASDGDAATIEDVLRDYAEGADTRDVERVRSALHAESVQYVQLPQGLTPISRDQYLQLLEARRIGGQDRTMTVQSVEVGKDEIAWATMELEGALPFLQHVSLAKVDDAWQIVSIVTSVR